MSVDLKTLFDPSAISPETAAFNAKLEAELAEAPLMSSFPPEVVRQFKAEGKGALPLGGPLEGSDWHDIPGTEGGPGQARITEPDGEPTGIYLHFHGGGWTIGSADQYDSSCQYVARETGMRVISIAYRLAPEHPWPAQYDDCMAGARWALAQSDLPVVMAGESAGAHLALVTALGLRAEGLIDRVRGLVLFYGVYDLRGTPSVVNWGSRNMILSTEVMTWFYNNIEPDAAARATPALSPLLADVSAMPPARFIVGTEDPLMDDTLFMASRWHLAGNVTELDVYPGGVHAFDAFTDLPIGQEARAKAARFTCDCL